MNTKKFVYLVAVCAFFCAATFAQELGSSVPIKEPGQSHELSFENQIPVLLPDSPYSEVIKKYVFGNFSDKAGHAYEKLYTVPKSVFPKDVTIEDASVLMRSISKMQGMLYYSRSDKQWNVLYKEAFSIDGEFGTEPVADSMDGSADGKTLYAYMNDHTFGKGWYQIKYRQSKNQLVMFMENRSALKYKIVRAVMPGDFKMCATVIDNGDYFTVYMCDYAEFKIIQSLRQRLNNSFEARLEAIYVWFTKLGDEK